MERIIVSLPSIEKGATERALNEKKRLDVDIYTSGARDLRQRLFDTNGNDVAKVACALVTVKELGFSSATELVELYRAAAEQKMGPLPIGAVAQVMLNHPYYSLLPGGTMFGIDPVLGSTANTATIQYVLRMQRNMWDNQGRQAGEPYLSKAVAMPDRRCSPKQHWVFALLN